MISYEVVGAAIEWLGGAFGFRECGERFTDGEGRVTHAELELDGATIMLGWPGPDYRSPKRHAEECELAARWLATPWVIDGVHVEVGHLDAHYERARAAGASVLHEPENLPFGRLYSAADLEGHRWMFMQPR
jgi:PhnB protein